MICSVNVLMSDNSSFPALAEISFTLSGLSMVATLTFFLEHWGPVGSNSTTSVSGMMHFFFFF